MALEAFAAAAGGAAVLQYIDTGIKVAEFLISERLPLTINNIRSFFNRTEDEKPLYFDPNEVKDFVGSLMKIDSRILEVIGDNINDAIDNYAICLKSANGRQEKNACDIRAERAVCDSLNRIMDKNNDELPSEYLKSQWDSFRCIRI